MSDEFLELKSRLTACPVQRRCGWHDVAMRLAKEVEMLREANAGLDKQLQECDDHCTELQERLDQEDRGLTGKAE